MEMIRPNYEQLNEDYQRVEQAIAYLEQHIHEQPGLKEMAESVGLSEYHFQRVFTRWVGISPKRFLQYLTKEHAKGLLEQAGSLLDVTYETGLSSPGRLHDLFVSTEAVTPGEFKNRGEGLRILYGFHSSPFGECLLAMTERGVCSLAFVEKGEREGALQGLRQRWAKAELAEDQDATGPVVERIFEIFQNGGMDSDAAGSAGEAGPGRGAAPLRLYLTGTNFQIKVWEALLRIPSGRVVSYEDIAVQIGMPGATRAVSNAIGRNPIPVIIPCHRVIRKAGDFGGYRWGTARKKALLGWEAAQAWPASAPAGIEAMAG